MNIYSISIHYAVLIDSGDTYVHAGLCRCDCLKCQRVCFMARHIDIINRINSRGQALTDENVILQMTMCFLFEVSLHTRERTYARLENSLDTFASMHLTTQPMSSERIYLIFEIFVM